MDQNPKADLKDAEKKLAELKNRLECLMQIVYGSKNVDSKDVLNAVKELQSLCEWAAQKQDAWSQDVRLFLQLQGLQNIQQSLEETSRKDDIDVPNEKICSPEVGSDIRVQSQETHQEDNCLAGLNHPSQRESITAPERNEQTCPDENRLTFDSEDDSFYATSGCLFAETDQAAKEKDDDVLNFLSNGLEILLKSNEEIKEFLASSVGTRTGSSAASSTIGIIQSPCSDAQDLLSSDIEDMESSFDEKALNILTKPFSEACDLLTDEVGLDLKSKNSVKNIAQPNELNLLTYSNSFEKPSSKEGITGTESGTGLIKYVTDKDVSGILENKDILIKTETNSKGNLLNNLDISTQPECEMQKRNSKLQNNAYEDVLSNDLSLYSQSSAELRDLVLTDCPKIAYPDSHFQNMNLAIAERAASPNTEIRNISPFERNGEPFLIDLLTSDDDFSKVSNEEDDRCKTPCSVHCTKPAGKEIMLLEAKEDEKTVSDTSSESKINKDPLDICMFAIRNLYDNLRAKENELLKMSVLQNDQKHIEALQSVVLDFHKEITELRSKVTTFEKENSLLKEQVLELEEAENDARLKAQKFEQKVSFLQEKDSHSQGEIAHLKKKLKITSEKLSEKEGIVKELRSQVVSLESLARKYEDRIKELEAKENELKSIEKVPTSEKGSQTYPLLTKLDKNVFTSNGNTSSEFSLPDETSQTFQDHQAKDAEHREFSSKETAQSEDQYVITIQDGEMLKEFNDRLLALMHEDANLKQQIQNVDQINLTLWTKLQNLENNIGSKEEKLDSSPHRAGSPADNSIDGSKLESMKSLQLLDSEKGPHSELAYNANEKAVRVQKELKETEKLLISDLKTLAFQKDELVEKIEKLESEKTKFEEQVNRQQAELSELKEKNQIEVSKLRSEQETICATLQHKVNQLIAEEKNLLKMIKNLKSDRSNKNQAEAELERLKSSYIQLQLELSHSREEKRKMEQNYKLRIDECVSKHKEGEAYLMKELDRQRQEKIKCDETIKEHRLKQLQLTNALEKKELDLRQASESYEKSLADVNRKHQSVEIELKNELMKLEEKTLMATSALMEERLKVEKELQENINQLREKEESYIDKIANLETNMNILKEELNKVTQAPDRNVEDSVIHGARASQKYDKATKVPSGSPKSNILLDRYMDARPVSEPEPKQFSRDVERFVPQVSDSRQQLSAASNKIRPVKEENVEDLRSQVRDLQAQLEKISEEGAETSASASSVRSPQYLGWQKEELDYAEADAGEEEWKQPCMNSSSRSAYQQDRALKENRYPSRYRYKSEEKQQPERNSVEENDYDEILPRPTNFHLVQQVGPDALLVGWSYVNSSFLEGFEIYLDNRLHERIYIPDRTKALISGLNLRRSFTLSIRAVSHYGQLSEPASLELACQPKSEYYEEEEEEYSDTESSRLRPYSMEW